MDNLFTHSSSLLAKNPVTPSSIVFLYTSTSLATTGTPRAVNSMYFNSLLHLLNSVLTRENYSNVPVCPSRYPFHECSH